MKRYLKIWLKSKRNITVLALVSLKKKWKKLIETIKFYICQKKKYNNNNLLSKKCSKFYCFPPKIEIFKKLKLLNENPSQILFQIL